MREWEKFFKILKVNEVKDTSNIGFTWKSGEKKSNIDKIFVKSENSNFSFLKNKVVGLSDHNLIIIKQQIKIKNKNISKFKRVNELKLNENV